MRKKRRSASLADYISEILKNAVYEKGEALEVIVAEAPDLPGCVTQGATVEEARENLVDAIEVWLMSGLRSGEDPPVVNLSFTHKSGVRSRGGEQTLADTALGALSVRPIRLSQALRVLWVATCV